MKLTAEREIKRLVRSATETPLAQGLALERETGGSSRG